MQRHSLSMDHHFEHPSDDAVMATNDDASECKRSAVRLGYWQDEYIGHFVKSTDRRAPEINRGYFARIRGIERLVEGFLEKTGNKCQIINLGCGFDTLYWRLLDAGHRVQNFVEVDFPTVTSRKCYAIKRNKHLLGKIHTEDGEVRFNLTDLHAPNYHVVGADLRNLEEVAKKLRQADIDLQVPTVMLAECVLVYVEPANCAALLQWLAASFASAVFVNYEQVNMRDRFGDVMLSNLRSRGCTLAGVEACVSLESQQRRFLDCGFHGSRAFTMVQVYDSIPAAERQRVEKIEMLDEGELLVQLFQHYAISVSWIGALFADVQIPMEKRLSDLNIDGN